MTISYPLELPIVSEVIFKNLSVSLDYAQATSESPFTLVEQIYSYEAERWTISIQYPPLTPDQAKPVRGFILALRGRIGTFKVGDPLNALPKGSAGLSVQVDGGGQTGYTLNVKGLTPSSPLALASGDDIEIGGRLYTVVKDTISTAQGKATLDIMPALRGTITDNQAITTAYPKGLYRLENAKTGWSASASRSYDISFTAVEA